MRRGLRDGREWRELLDMREGRDLQFEVPKTSNPRLACTSRLSRPSR
jgi:hypothetical protein